MKNRAIVIILSGISLALAPGHAATAPAANSALTSAEPTATLTVEQAISLAIQSNLNSQLAKSASEEARGRALQAAAGLLPRLTGTVEQSRHFKTNLAAQGFNSLPVPGFNPLIGPYNTFDARLQLVQTLLDFNVLWVRQAARLSRKVAEAQELLAREQVAAAAALAYVEAQRAIRSVTAAEADLRLSQSFLKLARDQHQAGVSTGVDVARAETDAAQQNLRLIRAQVTAQQTLLRLLRVVGLPLDKPVVLSELPQVTQADALPVESAIAEGEKDRPEMRIADESFQMTEAELRAERAQYAPSVQALADYGFSGNTPASTARTGSIGGRLTLPIFAGGNTRGRIVTARALSTEAQERAKDIHAQVEEDIRLSQQTLAMEIQETQTADVAAGLAQKEVKMAHDRFAAGVGDNIQLLSAQTALSRAMDDQVEAFARYATARINLAAALGHMQEFKP